MPSSRSAPPATAAARGRRPPSPAGSSDSSTVSSTDSEDASSTASSTSGSRSSTSSGSVDSRTDAAPSSPSRVGPSAAAGRPAAAAQAAAGTPQDSTATQALRQVQLNPDLHFDRPDKEYIPLPRLKDMQEMHRVLLVLCTNKALYPERRHRTLDYFRVAVEMFVTEVRLEFKRQAEQARRGGREFLRFTWRNAGELAICFACCCDNLKLLYDTLQPGPLKPLWDAFVGQLTPLLMAMSRVPDTVLSAQTYHTKYMDWVKGGTRYGGDQASTNIRFPSAADRRVKVETYLRSGAGYKIEAMQVPMTAAAASPVAPRPATAATVAPPVSAGSDVRPPFAGRLPGSTAVTTVGAKVPLAPGVGGSRPPVKLPMKHIGGGAHGGGATAAPPLASTGVKQMPPEMRHLFWLSVLAHVKGGEPTRSFPDERIEALPGLLRLCEMTEQTEEMLIVMDVLAASSGGVQTVFERLGGLLSFRRFASHFIQAEEAGPLMQLVEQLARWRVAAWGGMSQQAWLTDMSQRCTRDLTWLRTQPAIPEEKRAVWGALLLVMEQRFVFKPARPDETALDNPLKRRRAESGGGGDLRAVLSDNVDMQRWVVPRVNVFSAVRLPLELRVPPLCTKLEEDTVRFLNTKRAYAERTQVEWRERLEKILHAQPRSAGAAVSVPLWYDPYALLSVASPKP